MNRIYMISDYLHEIDQPIEAWWYSYAWEKWVNMVQVMACHLSGNLPLPKLMLYLLQLNPEELNQSSDIFM